MTTHPFPPVTSPSGSDPDPHLGSARDPRRDPRGAFRDRVGIVGRCLARGLGAGVVLGAAYRGWMRLVATDPSFSWEGTLAIVLVVTIVTLAASACAQVRASVHRRWVRGPVRVLAAALILFGLGSPPATVTVPAFVVGALAWGRSDWTPTTRRRLAVGAVVLAVASLFTPVFELGALPLARATAAVAGYGVLIAISSRLLAIPLASSRRDPTNRAGTVRAPLMTGCSLSPMSIGQG